MVSAYRNYRLKVGSQSRISLGGEAPLDRLATAGLVVVSGGARGIDAAAPSWGIEGGRPDVVFPGTAVTFIQLVTRELSTGDLAADGALISEVLPEAIAGDTCFGYAIVLSRACGCARRGCCG